MSFTLIFCTVSYMTTAQRMASIARDPLWLAEAERIKSDLSLVRDYPNNKETVLRRMAEYRELRTEPFFTE